MLIQIMIFDRFIINNNNYRTFIRMDAEEIDLLLKETRLNGISDIIKFIMNHITRTLNFDPLDDLSLRVQQLQRPKGLDRVMIEEVKTLVQAMIQQRDFQFKREVDRQISSTISTLEHRQNKKVLNEIDVLQIMNTQMSSKIAPKRQNMEEQKRYSSELLMRQITEIRLQLQKKVEKRELGEIKNNLGKELMNKISIVETQKIVKRFQEEVFDKMKGHIAEVKKIEQNIKKILTEELELVKKQFIDGIKDNEIIKQKEIKSTITKLDKKIKLHIEESKNLHQSHILDCQQANFSIKQDVKNNQKEAFDQINQICQLIQQLSYKKQKSGRWLANGHTKSQSIIWDKQLINSDSDLYKFQQKKTPIMVSTPGFYLISCYVFGCNKPPTLMLNSDTLLKLQPNITNNTSISHFKAQSAAINILQNRSLISLKMENEEDYQHAILIIEKV